MELIDVVWLRGRDVDQSGATTWQPDFSKKVLINYGIVGQVDQTPDLYAINQQFNQ
jgi:hypothetical protein